MVRFARYQMKETLPPPRRAASPLASIVGHDESSKPLSPAWGWMSYDALYSGMALAIAAPSTIFASMVFHCAPKTADPSGVIKSTTCAGVSDGGILGSGGAGAVAEGAGACAVAIGATAAMSNAAAASSDQRSRLYI